VITRKFDEIVAFAEVERFIDTPVKHYSSGMYLRLAFAVAAHLEPEILLVDEVLAVGDAAFQAKCLGKMGEVAQEGRTILFVSHNMGAIRALCSKGIVLNEGRITRCGSPAEAIETYYGMINASKAESNNGSKGMGPGRDAPGFGPVMLPDRGHTTISQSEEFRVATTLNVAGDVAGCTLWCILEDMHGRQIFHLREESSLLGIGPIKKGTYNISVRIPPLWLLPGLYALHFKVRLWGSQTASRLVSDVFPLDVDGGNPRSDAVLNPAVAWSVKHAGSD
jgi:lipopolysaccharide transport system ATP-binding protein